MNRLVSICFIMGITASFAFSKAPKYFSAKVKAGETIANFLNRHQLTMHDCNLDLFCSLNKIKNRNIIVASKAYILPVKLIKFNGKSIRSSIGTKDKELAKRIEAYNEKINKIGIKPRAHTKSNLLWVPMEEFTCMTKSDRKIAEIEKIIPTLKTEKIKSIEPNEISVSGKTTVMKRKGIKEINIPLMGPMYELVNIEDFSLEGQVYYIISGHGGPDPGAVCTECPNKLCEDEYAYDVSLRLARNLMQHGATVHMIVQDGNDGIRDDEYLKCDGDEDLLGKNSIPLSQKQRLRDRAEAVNKLYRKYKKKGVKIQKAIEIHVDSRSKEKRQDVFFYYNKNNTASKTLANTVQDVFESKYATHQKERGYQGFVEDRGLYMVRNLKPTTLFVELANIRNFEDQKRLLINTNRQALANWLFEGMRK